MQQRFQALCLLLNSKAVDACYRQLSGTASISVTLLRRLDLPSPQALKAALARNKNVEEAVEDAASRFGIPTQRSGGLGEALRPCDSTNQTTSLILHRPQTSKGGSSARRSARAFSRRNRAARRAIAHCGGIREERTGARCCPVHAGRRSIFLFRSRGHRRHTSCQRSLQAPCRDRACRA